MNPSAKQVKAGQAIYTKANLYIYDFVVMTISNRFIWKCSTRSLLNHYNKHISSNHLDVGVGTGYFLDNCRIPSSHPRIGLMDLNENTLNFTARRIARYKPEIYLKTVLSPINIDAKGFDSIGLNYLLHCLPGSLVSKAIVFDHLHPLMNADAVVFGSTLLQGVNEQNWCAKQLMNFYNNRKIFSNKADHLEDLKQVLNSRFENTAIHKEGCAAVFVCKKWKKRSTQVRYDDAI